MHTFAKNPGVRQPAASASSAILGQTRVGHSHDVNAIHRAARADAPQRQTEANTAASEATTTAPSLDWNFGRMPVHAPAPIRLQTKLKLGMPGDVHEQEADRVAEQVMRMPEPSVRSKAPADISGHAMAPTARVQTKSTDAGDSGGAAVPPIVYDVLCSPGQPLDASTRAFMEPRFGWDFGKVRLHADARAAEAATAINAVAYTVGSDIAFGAGEYAPGTGYGRRLLAHELTHVTQQARSQHLGSAVVQRQGGSAEPMEKLVREESFRKLLAGVGDKDFQPDKKKRKREFNREDFDQLLNQPATKRLMDDLSIKYKTIAPADLPLTTDPQKADNKAARLLSLTTEQAGALAFSLGMLRARNQYLDSIAPNLLVPAADTGNAGQSAWLNYKALKAAHNAATSKEEKKEIEDRVAMNPDMPLNMKAAFLVGLKSGGDPFSTQLIVDDNQKEQKSRLGYVPKNDINYAKLSDETSGAEWRKKRSSLLKDQMETSINDLIMHESREIFKYLTNGGTVEMPSQYLAAMGEGGTSTGMGRPLGGKSNVGVGYFMYEDYDVNRVVVPFPDNGEALKIFFGPYGWDKQELKRSDSGLMTPVAVNYAVQVEVRFGGEWIKITFRPPTTTLKGMLAPTPPIVAKSKPMKGVELSGNTLTIPNDYAGTPRQPAQMTVTHTQPQLLKELNDPKNKKGQTDIYLNELRDMTDSRMIDEIQLQLSANAPITTRHNSYGFVIPKPDADAATVFEQGRFVISDKLLTKSGVTLARIEDLAGSISDKDFAAILAPDDNSQTLNRIFALTGGGINPKVTDKSLHNKSPSEVRAKINDAKLAKLRSVIGQKILIENEKLKKFKDDYVKPKDVAGEMERDQREKEAIQKLRALDYIIQITAFTDPVTTGDETRVFNTDVADLEKKYDAKETGFGSAIKPIEAKDATKRNDLLSALRAVEFLKLLLRKKATQMDAVLPAAERHFSKNIEERFSTLTVNVAARGETVAVNLGQLDEAFLTKARPRK